MNIKGCDYCRKPIMSDLAPSLSPGDGNAYGVWVNRINGEGWREGDYHTVCLRKLLTRLLEYLNE